MRFHLITLKVHKLCLWVIFFVPVTLSYTQEEVIRFEHIGMDQGLPQGQILDIKEDSEGFLWFSTMTGLIKYDGYKFVHFRHDPDDSTSLHNVTPYKIIEDKAGDLWIGSHGGASRWNRKTNRFTSLRHAENYPDERLRENVETLLKDQKGRLWLSIPERLLVYHNDSIEIIAESIHCSSIIEDRQGIIWGATNIGLLKIDPETNSTQTFPIGEESRSSSALDVFQDDYGRYWVGTVNGFFQWEPGKLEFSKIQLPGNQNQQAIRDIIQDKQGHLWLATLNDNGLFRYHPQTGEIEHFTHDPENSFSLSSNHVRVFCIDQLNQLWIGTYNGLNKLDLNPPRFPLLQFKPGLGHPENLIKSVYMDRREGLWTSTYDQRLFYAEKPGKKAREVVFDSFEGHKQSPFENFVSTKDQEVWFNFRFGEIFSYQPKDNSYRIINELFPKLGQIKLYPHSFFALDKNEPDVLWIAAADGLLKIDLETKDFQLFCPKNDLQWFSTDETKTALQVGKEYIYIKLEKKFNHKLARFNKSSKTFEPIEVSTAFPSGKSSLHIRQFVATSDGAVWMATAEGLGIIYPGTDTLTLLRLPDGLIDDNIMGIAADEQDNIWIKSLHHITKYHPELDSFWHFRVGKDMQEFNTVGVTKGIDGRLFFYGNNGIYVFHPDSIRLDTALPKVELTDFSVLNEPRHFGTSPELIQDIVLGHRDNVFSFEFTGLHNRDPQHARYKYRLKNFDRDWREAGPERKATYTNLKAGNYVFMVMAANADGIWNERHPLKVNLKILPPPWLTWWAYAVYLFLICLFGYLLYRFLLSRRLEKEEAKRLREMDEVKTKLYTNITHEFRTPLTIILGMADKVQAEPHNWLFKGTEMIKRNGRNLLHLINQMLDLSKIESGSLELQLKQGNVIPFLHYILESFQSLAASKKIKLHFLPKQEEIILDFDQEKLQNILSNLLSNAIKFTPEGGDVYVTVRSELKRLFLIVRDTGIGIPEEQLPHVFDRFYQADSSHSRRKEGTGIGLALCQELVQLMNGSIQVQSQAGKGSSFEMTLPINREAPHHEMFHTELQVGSEYDHYTEEQSAIISPSTRNDDRPVVLLIEDNKDVADFVQSCLKEPFQTIVAYDGEKGIQKAIEEVPDVIVCDVMMPEKNGFEVCDILKKDERTSHIPIVILTAKADRESRLNGFNKGADAYLSKPFDEKELKIRLAKMIEIRRQLQERYASFKLPKSKKHNIEDDFLKKVWTIVDDHLSDADFDLAQLCRALKMSRSQVYRKLKALTGKSTSHVIRSYRLQKGKELLKSSDMNISEVAYQVGFTSLSYFTRCFKEEFGTVPKSWRS